MRSTPRLLVFTTFLVLMVALVVQVSAPSSEDGSRQSFSGSIRQLLREMARREKLAHYGEILREVCEAKRSIVRDLIEDRTTLDEALDGFIQLNTYENTNLSPVIPPLPQTNEERLFKEILGWVKGELPSKPCEYEQVSHRLHEQWAALQDAGRAN